jgi:ubiquinone/menaquinone biosynthesis C-methylase UbiE
MDNLKKNSLSEFNKAAKRYDFYAFNKSVGLSYLSYLETIFIQKHLKQSLEKKLYLDLGIGTGRISRILLDKNIEVKGMDFSDEMIKLSKHNLEAYVKKKQIHFYKGDLNEKLPFQDNSFDGAICIRVIKYVRNWRKAIDEVSRVIKPNGVFILEYPNFYSVQSLSRFYAGFLTFKPSEINSYLLESGFKIIHSMNGVKFPFYLYKYINSESKLNKLLKIEKILDKLFDVFLSHNIMLYCIKI